MHPSPISRTAMLAAVLLACSFDATGLGDEVGGTPTPGVTSVSTDDSDDSGVTDDTGLADPTGTVDDTGGSGEATGNSDPSDPTGPTTDPTGTCGDGTLDPGEACDGGPNNSGGMACTPDCTTNSCGDSYVGAGEACDPGPDPPSGLACTPGCTANSCGDGYLGADEVCDDGVDNGTGQACTDACIVAICGDGMPGPDETCDDGNANNNDACLNTCLPGTCGDDFLLEGTENCDEGMNNGVYGGPCNLTCDGAAPNCGDGMWEQTKEQCDGNDRPDGVNCDGGCKATCQANHADCNSNIADGCEDLKTDKDYCGMCNKKCVGFFNFCINGTCSLG